VRSTHPKHVKINDEIDELIDKAKEAVKALDNEKKLLTSDSIKQRILQVDYSSVIDFAKSLVVEMEKNGQVGSAKKYNTLINRLAEISETGELFFIELTHSFLVKFNRYLLSVGNSDTTAGKYLKALRAVYRRATVEGLTDQLTDPFLSFRIRTEQVKKERLNEKEITKIEELDLPRNSLIWHIRNAFMFSFYGAGIRASDILQLKWKNIVNGRLVYQMHKTNRVQSLKLHEKLNILLNNYGPHEHDQFIFPFFNSEVDYSNPLYLFNQISAKTALLNKYLKIIATKAEINKKISTHTARHSFADIARQKTDNIYNLSKTMGHSSIKITEAYLASFDDAAADDTLDKVFPDGTT
jgi:integrase